MKKTSIVILSYNTYALTKLCIQSIRRYTIPGSYELIVVENASTDESAEWLRAQHDVIGIYNQENVGFPRGCNQGMGVAKGDAILLLNSDTVVTPRWLEQLEIALYSDARIGAVGCVTNACSNFQQISVPYKDLKGLFAFAENYNHSDCTKWEKSLTLVGFCFLFRREIYDTCGGLDEAFSPGNCEDDDFSLRIWLAGYQCILCRDTFIHHFGSASFIGRQSLEEQEKKQKTATALLEKNLSYLKKKWELSDNYKWYDTAEECLPDVLPLNTKILVVDCGCGMDLFHLAAKYQGIGLYGVALYEREAAIACAAGFSVEVCKDLYQDMPRGFRGFFDYIFLHHLSADYIEKPAFIRTMADYLAENGQLHFWKGEESVFLTKYEAAGFCGRNQSTEQVVIVVPVYKQVLSNLERISLQQLNKILRNYPKVFVAPESLEFDYGMLSEGYRIERFPNEYFTGISAYSQLMLSEHFYRRFEKYEYMLLYQLDAFVFSDRLSEFCAMGFDYIGAPVYRFTPHWHAIHCSVGNGGFSLRNIQSAIHMLEKHSEWMPGHPFADVFNEWEDLFWAYCGQNDAFAFRIPTVAQALEFAVQDDIAHIYKRMHRVLPFGCHGWYKSNFLFWKQYIKACGYHLKASGKEETGSFRLWYVRAYLQSRKKINLRLLYHALQCKNGPQVLRILIDWFMQYGEKDAAWKHKAEEFICIWRMFRTCFADMDAFAYEILTEAIAEAMRRTVAAGGAMWWQIDMMQAVLPQTAMVPHGGLMCLRKALHDTLETNLSVKYDPVEESLVKCLINIDGQNDIEENVHKIWDICAGASLEAEYLLPLIRRSVKNPQKVLKAMAAYADS